MKKEFIFDKSENDIIGIDENTVIRDTGVKTENVKETVMKTIKTEKKPVRKIKRKTVISLIAAAVAVAVVGTVTVGASGGFNTTFGEYFAGEPADGVYSGKDVTTESEKVDINFMGIAGDDNQVFAMMTIKNKDGSPFVKTTEDTFLDQFSWREGEDFSDSGEYSMVAEKTLWDSMIYPGADNFGDIRYSFKDEYTLNALVCCNCPSYTAPLKGRRLKINDEKVYAYTPVKTLYTARDGDGYSRYETYADGSQELITDGPILEEMYEKYESTLADNQVIMPDMRGSGTKVIIAEKTELDLDLNVEVTLNYKSTTLDLESANGKTYNVSGSEWTVHFLTAKSFTIELYADCGNITKKQDFDNEKLENGDTEEWTRYDDYIKAFIPNTLVITLEDGRVYTASPSMYGGGSGYNIAGDYGEMSMVYSYFDKNGNSAALDPKDIVSVTFNGYDLM